MRKNNGTLNPALSRVISETGHTDEIAITDAGLPIPTGVERIDFALAPGTPGFLEVLDVVLNELEVEGVIAAEEIRSHSPAMFAELTTRLDALGVSVQLIPHAAFKERTRGARAAVRSGETTSYANVILQAGVVY